MEQQPIREKSNRPVDQITKKRMIGRASFLLFGLGLTQLATAKELGISQVTMCRWVKELGWSEKLKDKSLRAAVNMKFNDSLSAFVVYVGKKHKHIYPSVEKAYEEFIKKY